MTFFAFTQISTHPPKVMQFYLHINGESFIYSRCIKELGFMNPNIAKRLNWLWQLSCPICFDSLCFDWLSGNFFYECCELLNLIADAMVKISGCKKVQMKPDIFLTKVLTLWAYFLIRLAPKLMTFSDKFNLKA